LLVISILLDYVTEKRRTDRLNKQAIRAAQARPAA
jgi:hypothetical protein